MLATDRADAAALPRDLLVAGPAQPTLELARTVAGEDEMGVTIDEAGRDPASLGVVNRRTVECRQIATLADPDDPALGHGDGAIVDRAVGLAALGHRSEAGILPDLGPVWHRGRSDCQS